MYVFSPYLSYAAERFLINRNVRGAIIIAYFIICILSLQWSGTEELHDLYSAEQRKPKEDACQSPAGVLDLQVISFSPIAAWEASARKSRNMYVAVWEIRERWLSTAFRLLLSHCVSWKKPV